MGKWHGGKGTRLYSIWKAMKTRCNNPNFHAYNRYGGRGIKVCPEWENDFSVFRNWALENGYQDSLTIDRIDNDKGYSPENCRCVTYKTQANNTRRNVVISYNGETGTISSLCAKCGVDEHLVYDRVTRLGWDGERAMSTPKRKIIKEAL